MYYCHSRSSICDVLSYGINLALQICMYLKPNDVVELWLLLLSFFIPKILAIKVAVKLRLSRRKSGLGAPIYRGNGYRRFRTFTFKSHSVPSMWPISVEFCSPSSEGSWQKKNMADTRRRKIAVTPKGPPTTMSGCLINEYFIVFYSTKIKAVQTRSDCNEKQAANGL